MARNKLDTGIKQLI